MKRRQKQSENNISRYLNISANFSKKNSALDLEADPRIFWPFGPDPYFQYRNEYDRKKLRLKWFLERAILFLYFSSYLLSFF